MRSSNWIFALFAVAVVTGCSSSAVKVEVEEPDFRVLEAAPGGREAWLDNPQEYADDKGLGVKDGYFYTGEAKSADKRLACEKAQANVVDDVAKQVATFTDTSIARALSESGQTDSTQGFAASQVSEETQRISSQLSKAQISNVMLNKTYWERRDYSQASGPKNIYLCWVLASIDKKQINTLVSRASSMRVAQDAELKAKVEKKLEGIDQKYEEWQKTH